MGKNILDLHLSMYENAVSIYLLERIGKDLCTPVRDAVSAEVTEGISRGKGFRIHEVMN
ncbi:MAG: hypothetical protein N3E36_05105 [Sulfolobales archaeon]|nr:hypothetical protein [Sulfolobales archaeon]MCX8199390.1 hypothetical protein [Sulfolobales archaeon]MDW8170296.1 hypothetical protein [Desulfurococcaceae archaeon]